MKASKQVRELVGGFLLAALIGVCGGAVSLLFRGAADSIQEWLGVGEDILAGARALGEEAPWKMLLLPLGGALCAWLVRRFLVRGDGGIGLTDVMEAVSIKRGSVTLGSVLSRSLASLCIIVTGGSVGREGPIIAISAATASAVARLLRVPMRERGMLLGCGVAAGFAAAYHAPFAGALFAMEVVLGNFATRFFAPLVVAAVSTMLFLRHIANVGPLYEIEGAQFAMVSTWEVIPYLVLGVVAGCAAVGFQWVLRSGARVFERAPGPVVAKMAVGGAAIGAVGIAFPEVWGNGRYALGEILSQSGPRLGSDLLLHVAMWMLVLMVVKAVGTSITVGSGGAGGVFTPTLFVGAALGGAFGVLVKELAPHEIGPYGGYALVGMGCLVAGTTRAPITAVMVVFEMSHNFEIVLPLMLGCITATIVARVLYPHSIYLEKLTARGGTLPDGIEETVLMTSRVTDIMRSEPPHVSAATKYSDVIQRVSEQRVSCVYVCSDEGRLLGVIQVHDVIDLASMEDLGPTIVAADLMVPVEPVTPQEPLASAFETFERNDRDEIPVVAAGEEPTLLGTVTRRDVMATLHIEVLKRQNLRAKFVSPAAAQTDYVELPKGAEVARVPVHPEHVGRTMGDVQVRVNHGLTVVSVLRPDADGQVERILPTGSYEFGPLDSLIVLGNDQAVADWRDEVQGDDEAE